MTVEEMAAKVEGDLEQWLSQIGVVICAAKKGITRGDAEKAAAVTTVIAGKMILERNWKYQAVQAVKDHGTIPMSCMSIELMCHAMAHCLADFCNRYIKPPDDIKFDCTCFTFLPVPPKNWRPDDQVPMTERIKFSHN